MNIAKEDSTRTVDDSTPRGVGSFVSFSRFEKIDPVFLGATGGVEDRYTRTPIMVALFGMLLGQWNNNRIVYFPDIDSSGLDGLESFRDVSFHG